MKRRGDEESGLRSQNREVMPRGRVNLLNRLKGHPMRPGPTGCVAFWGFLPASVLQHVFDKNSISLGGVLNKNVSNGPDQLPVLDDRAAAHSLDDSAGEA